MIICSFCGRPQEESHKMIAGPDVYICDECVILCNRVLIEESFKKNDELDQLNKELKATNNEIIESQFRDFWGTDI